MPPQSRQRLFLYPEPVRAPDVPSRTRTSINPTLYGWLLLAAAFLMESVGFIRRGAWKNAGFGRIRNIWEHLLTTEPRYDPTVYPVEQHGSIDAETAEAEEETLDLVSASQNSSAALYRSLYLSGELTPLDVVQVILPLIRRDTTPPGEHSIAFLEVHVDLVVKAAAASTLRYKENRSLGPLDGVPTAVKDEYDMEGYRTTLGSSNDYATFSSFRDDPDEQNGKNVSSWCVRMAEEAGAIILGKLTLHEFGLDTTGCNTTYGTPRNPYNQAYYPGGSSSGSAYVVATGLVPMTLGSDGGGSIRIPASFCSIFGLKPTHGRLSFLPGQNHSNTAGVNGPLASDMQSLAALYNVISKPHPQSYFPPSRPIYLDSSNKDTTREKVIGIPEVWFDRAQPTVKRLCRTMIDRLAKEKGYSVVSIPMPLTQEGQVAHSITLLTDAATLLGDTKGLSAPNRLLLALGRTTPATDYLLAQKLRHVLMRHLAWLWQQHPGMIIVTPTTAIAGWPIRSESELVYGVSDGDQTIKSMEYVWMANYCGVPSISVPAGFAPPVGFEGGIDGDVPGSVPVGLMGMGEWCSEESLLQFGLDAEEVGREVQRRPPTWVDIVAKAKRLRVSMVGMEAGT
ncbi:hypothetical protein QQS21_009722 [Conoideocrella luteorostrata]|uniref:Amidase domain-containing protein n=1 Tax=Conoideocrella luteorostrata TaxID=1105319 RepID=A0AAJ0CHC4_9HYPO|nr:hypothetical protein QQS21_009722 [Conoideocrella luteorostrata]